MATFKSIVLTSANHIKNDGTVNIKIRIYHKRESQYIPTGHYIDPKHMGSDGEITQACINADHYNLELGDLIQKYRRILIKINSESLQKMSALDLKNYIEEVSNPQNDFIDFVEFSQNIIAKIEKPKTASWYNNALQSLTWHFGKEKIDIKEITSKKLESYIEKLSVKGPAGKPLEARSIVNYLEAIRSLFKSAMNEYNDEDLDIVLNYMQGWIRSEFPPSTNPADASFTARKPRLPDLTYS